MDTFTEKTLDALGEYTTAPVVLVVDHGHAGSDPSIGDPCPVCGTPIEYEEWGDEHEPDFYCPVAVKEANDPAVGVAHWVWQP